MHFVWEKQDIEPGRKYSKTALGEVWMIGYLSSHDDPDNWVAISMNDGMVIRSMSREYFANMLTENCYVPVEFLKE